MRQSLRNILFVFLLLNIFCLSHIFAEQDSLPNIVVRLEPETAGLVIYENVSDSLRFEKNDFAEIRYSLKLLPGWMPSDTQIFYDKDGLPTSLVFIAEKLDQSQYADSVILSEIFFCAELSDSLENWIELTNISTQVIELDSLFFFSSSGSFLLKSKLVIPPKSCVQLFDSTGMDFNLAKDSLLIVDKYNRIISRFVWDSGNMNYPMDSIFSLEIIDVFADANEVSNWEIIFGHGRPSLLPVEYENTIRPVSVWFWLKYVIWGIVAFVLFLVFAQFVKSKS
jgi:hypothetical protein